MSTKSSSLLCLTMLAFVWIFSSCRSEKIKEEAIEVEQIALDSKKWKVKEEGQYVHRSSMVDDILYNDTIRKLSKSEIYEVLGDPDREQENHLYYLISQKKLGNWPLSTTTLVIKINEKDRVEWIKLHG